MSCSRRKTLSSSHPFFFINFTENIEFYPEIVKQIFLKLRWEVASAGLDARKPFLKRGDHIVKRIQKSESSWIVSFG
jgi:hypothetical protein